MAVQAALPSTHSFVPFGFGATSEALGGAFGALDKGCCFEDDEIATPASALLAGTEGGDVREATRDLLSFIDSASSNIKLALDKPGKSKRKVNHRKYLQKQIKRCSGLIGSTPPGPPSPGFSDTSVKRPPLAVGAPGHGKTGLRRDASQAAAASLQSRSLAALFDSLRPGPGHASRAGGALAAAAGAEAAGSAGGAAAPGARKVPLRARNLPRSFFTEPSRAAGSTGPAVGLGDLEKGTEAGEFFELLGADYGAGPDGGVLLAAEPLDVFAPGVAVLRGPELEPGVFEPPPVLAGNLLYPETWSVPGCPAAKKSPPGVAPRGGLTLTEPLRPLFPATDSPSAEDGPGLSATFAPFFSDSVPPAPPLPPQGSYEFGSAYGRSAYGGLWRLDGVWDGAPGEEGARPD